MPTTYNGDEEERRLTSAQRERTRASCLAERTAIGIVFSSVIVADWLGWRSIGLSCAIGQSQGRGRIGLGFNADFLIDALFGHGCCRCGRRGDPGAPTGDAARVRNRWDAPCGDAGVFA